MKIGDGDCLNALQSNARSGGAPQRCAPHLSEDLGKEIGLPANAAGMLFRWRGGGGFNADVALQNSLTVKEPRVVVVAAAAVLGVVLGRGLLGAGAHGVEEGTGRSGKEERRVGVYTKKPAKPVGCWNGEK
jgi:hypothetical protein